MDKLIREHLKKIEKAPYNEYYCSVRSQEIIRECIRLEMNYRLNCSDFAKDYSVTASNRRWDSNMRRLREK